MKKIKFLFLIIMFFLIGCTKQHSHDFVDGVCTCGETEIITFNVTFKDIDGSVLKIENVLNGSSVAKPGDPVKEGYVFIGWFVNDLPYDFENVVTSDLELIAKFEEEFKEYTVKFVVNDNETIVNVKYGEKAASPIVEEKEGYSFIGWDKEFDYVTSDLVVTALFERIYNIVLKDIDGTTLLELALKKGEVPFYDYQTIDTDEYAYEFTGWSLVNSDNIFPTIPIVEDDATYYANVNKVKKQYSLNIYNYNNELTSSILYDYGTVIDELSYDEIDRMNFTGWFINYEKVTFPLTIKSNIDIYPKYEKELITVGSNGLFKTLQEGVNYAKDNDIIYVDSGTYEGATINKPLEIRGSNYNKQSTKYEGTIFTSNIIINSSNVTINGVVITKDAKFTFDNLDKTVENINFLYCSVINSSVNKDNERSTAPFNLVSNGDNIIKNVLLDYCYINKVDEHRAMVMYVVDVEGLVIQNSTFLGGSNKSSFNDGIKIDNSSNSKAKFGIRGNVVIKNNVFSDYSQYPIWFRQYSSGNYLIENNTFTNIGQTKDSHAAVNFIKGVNIESLNINVNNNCITNGYLLFRFDEVDNNKNINCLVNYNGLNKCNGTYYIKNGTNDLCIDATYNYFGTSELNKDKFYGNIDYSNHLDELYDIDGFKTLTVKYENYPYVFVGDVIKIDCECFGLGINDITLEVSDSNIISVDEVGNVFGLQKGKAYVTIYAIEYNIEKTLPIIVYDNSDLDDVSKYVLSIMNGYSHAVTAANSRTNYGVTNPYLYSIYRSATLFLFEDLEIDTESYKRDGEAKLVNNKVEYVTIHDTWAMQRTAEGLAQYFLTDKTSVHYTVGNDGIFQIIRLTDKGAHAGDSPYRAYALDKTNVLATTDSPVITMEDGYFVINGEKTHLRPYTDYDGTIFDMKNYETSQLTYTGIRCLIGDDGYYYLGKTYFNETYKTVCNFGGNANSIGIEMESQKGTDFFLNMQRTAKLVAMLLDMFDLTTDDVKMHNYFSGKNCAQLLKNNLKYEYNYQIDKHNIEDTLWDEFLELTDAELVMYRYFKDYSFEFISSDTSLLSNTGRVIGHNNDREVVEYQIKITNKNTNEVTVLDSAIVIPCSSEIDPSYIK